MAKEKLIFSLSVCCNTQFFLMHFKILCTLSLSLSQNHERQIHRRSLCNFKVQAAEKVKFYV